MTSLKGMLDAMEDMHCILATMLHCYFRRCTLRLKNSLISPHTLDSTDG